MEEKLNKCFKNEAPDIEKEVSAIKAAGEEKQTMIAMIAKAFMEGLTARDRMEKEAAKTA